MNIKRIFSVALCFLLLFGFVLGAYAEAQGNKNEILRYSQNDNEGAHNDKKETQDDNEGAQEDKDCNT